MSSAKAAGPQRRCVGCGRSAPKAELLRLVAADGLAVADPTAARPGRGAYICRGSQALLDPACLARATRRGGLARALRRPVRIAPGLISDRHAGEAPEGNRTGRANRLESIG